MQGGPTLIWTDAETDQQLARAESEIQNAEGAYRGARQTALARVSDQVDALLNTEAAGELAQRLDRSIADTTVAYYSFDRFLPFSWESAPEPLPQARRRRKPPTSIVFEPNPVVERSSSAAPATRRLPWGMNTDLVQFLPNEIETEGNTLGIVEAPILRPGVRGDALFFNDTNRGFLGRDVGWHDRTEEFAFDLWLLAAREYEDSLVIDHRDDDNSGASGYQLHLENNHLRFRLMYSWPFNMLEIVSRGPVPLDEWTHVTVTYDGSSRAEGIGLYVNGEIADVDVRKDHLTRTILPMSYSAILDPFVGMVFGKRFRQTGLVDGGALDEIRVFDRALTPLEVRFLHDGESALGMDSEILSPSVTEWAVSLDAGVVRAKNQLHEAREVHNQIVSLVPEVLVMGDTGEPRQTYVLDRGLYNQRRDPVDPQGAESVLPWDETLPRNRIGLAEWLFGPEHPLTSRVFVNRIWTMHFGRGIVNTPEDFGSQGSRPTHPELLDWLSVEFMESGWDIKALHKKIVMSATYRQTSDADDASLEKDPENRFLTRGMRQRMSAEVVRDNVLAVSGLLVPTIGGPSVKPYAPDGIWEGGAGRGPSFIPFYPAADAVPAEEHYRRSIYTFVKRSVPHPAMAVFDLADRNVSHVARNVSNTPLQALTLWNDPQFVEAYRVLASTAMGEIGDTDARLERLFRLAVRRLPTAAELSVLRGYYEEELERFRRAPENANAMVQIGVAPVDPERDVLELAALTNVAGGRDEYAGCVFDPVRRPLGRHHESR